MQLLHDAAIVLRGADFQTERDTSGQEILYFEDANLVGFIAESASVSDLLSAWRAQQDAFLKRSASALRRDPLKAWNIYAIFLTQGTPSSEETRELLAIEEDFTATRKIARAGVLSRTELSQAIAPILPLSASAVVDPRDSEGRLRERLDTDERALFDLIREGRTDEGRIIAWLLERVV